MSGWQRAAATDRAVHVDPAKTRQLHDAQARGARASHAAAARPRVAPRLAAVAQAAPRSVRKCMPPGPVAEKLPMSPYYRCTAPARWEPKPGARRYAATPFAGQDGKHLRCTCTRTQEEPIFEFCRHGAPPRHRGASKRRSCSALSLDFGARKPGVGCRSIELGATASSAVNQGAFRQQCVIEPTGAIPPAGEIPDDLPETEDLATSGRNPRNSGG